MGNTLFSELFDHENNAANEESVINLSDNCIEMIVKGVSNEKPNLTETSKDKTGAEETLPDEDWINKLKVMDDVHSNENGLTIPAVEQLLDKVESQVDKIRPQVCSTYLLMMCLKKNQNCMIKCKRLIDEFIDCVDKSRIEIVKEKIDEENKRILTGGEPGSELAKELSELDTS